MKPGPDLHTEHDVDPELEAALRSALQPVNPPAGFAERLLARIDSESPSVPSIAPTPRPAAAARGRLLNWPAARNWVTGAVAAALVAGMVEGGIALERLHSTQQQEHRVRAATEQFQTSQRITLRALAQAREQLQRAGVPLSTLE